MNPSTRSPLLLHDMFSDEETPISPPKSPPYTIASNLEGFVSRQIPSGEDSTSGPQHMSDEYENPTASPSTNLSLKLPDRPEPEPEPESANPDVESELDDSWKSSYVLIKVNEEKCALCYLDCSDFTPFHRVSHMKGCWGTLLEQVAEEKKRQRTLAELPKQLERFIEQHNEERPRVDNASSTSSISKLSGARKVLSPSKADALAMPSSGNVVGLLTLTGAATPWSFLFLKNVTITSFLLCKKDCASLTTLTAFSHRVHCLTYSRPRFCRICTAEFQYSSEWAKTEVAWHLHNCRNGGNLSAIDKDDFDALTAA
jgi:hypothetical protein